MRYYAYVRVALQIVPGTRLVLRREPDNPHDSRAISVFTEAAVKLGYVPRVDNAALSSLMDAGHELHAQVVAHGLTSGSPLWIAVTLTGVPAANRAT